MGRSDGLGEQQAALIEGKAPRAQPLRLLGVNFDVARPVYVDCTAEWADDPADKQHLWDLAQSSPPPLGFDPGQIFKGVDDADYGVLKFSPWRIELFDIATAPHRRVWLRNTG